MFYVKCVTLMKVLEYFVLQYNDEISKC